MSAIDGLADVFRYTDARRAGVSDRMLQRLRDGGEIEKLGRGLYRLTDRGGGADLDEIVHRAPLATLCLASAAAHHGLTDEIPATIDAAIPRGQRSPKTAVPVTWHRFDPATFEIGRGAVVIDGTAIAIYDALRTLCDLFRLQHLAGHDVAVAALRRWLQQAGAQPSQLLAVAHQFGPRAATPIRDALAILL